MGNKETLEEAAKKYANQFVWVEYSSVQFDFIEGGKWQAERMYSYEEVLNILYKHTEDMLAGKKVTLDEWFEQFKKK